MIADRAPASDVDPFDAAFLRDPWPHHARLRDAGPVVYLERYGIWSMARYDDVAATLHDWETFCSSAGAGMTNFHRETPWRKPSIILEADPPLHTRTHKVLLRALSPAALKALKPVFEREAGALVEDLVRIGTFDGAEDCARAFPLRVFPDAIGLRGEGREKLLTFGDMVFNAFGPRNERLETALAATSVVLPAIMEMCARMSLSGDGLGARVYDAVDAGDIAEDEAAMLVRSLLSAGLDTTIGAIAAALFCLARDPDAFDALRADESLARTAFDEAIRVESPVQTFFRTTTRATRAGDVDIPEDAKVLLFLASANRDPRRWDDADRYDLSRRTGGHVGFGSGIHRCVGELLSRLEGEALLVAIARRVRRMRLAGEPRVRLNNTIRSYDRLPLAFEA
ncbi:MAG TPA: cytochrome P450 [Candidatus Elarobacter sp.]|nr:cytochrome P450 [Candidatus Elarobacter sp.]